MRMANQTPLLKTNVAGKMPANTCIIPLRHAGMMQAFRGHFYSLPAIYLHYAGRKEENKRMGASRFV